jgi:hypothetical protein
MKNLYRERGRQLLQQSLPGGPPCGWHGTQHLHLSILQGSSKPDGPRGGGQWWPEVSNHFVDIGEQVTPSLIRSFCGSMWSPFPEDLTCPDANFVFQQDSAPAQIPRQLIKTRPMKARPHDYLHHGQLAQWTACPIDNWHHGQLAPWTA